MLSSPSAKLADKAAADAIDAKLIRSDVQTVLDKDGQSKYIGAWTGWWRSVFYDFTNQPHTYDAYVDRSGRRDRNLSDYPDVGLMCSEPFK